MRALAHPSRMALWELLTVHGPMTATQAAEHVDDSPSNCSFHLRRLARYGLVEEADDVVSVGRSRPWRVTHVGYTTRSNPDDDAAAALAPLTCGLLISAGSPPLALLTCVAALLLALLVALVSNGLRWRTT